MFANHIIKVIGSIFKKSHTFKVTQSKLSKSQCLLLTPQTGKLPTTINTYFGSVVPASGLRSTIPLSVVTLQLFSFVESIFRLSTEQGRITSKIISL